MSILVTLIVVKWRPRPTTTMSPDRRFAACTCDLHQVALWLIYETDINDWMTEDWPTDDESNKDTVTTSYKCRTPSASTCCGFVVQLVAVRQVVRLAVRVVVQLVVRLAACRTTCCTTSCTTSSKSHDKLDNLSHGKSTTNLQQVACNNQQVLQQVAHLVV